MNHVLGISVRRAAQRLSTLSLRTLAGLASSYGFNTELTPQRYLCGKLKPAICLTETA